MKALARMNYIHGQYQKAGKISNEDLLYTLSLFIKEPPRWIEEYEWRPLTDMEICAIATLWKSIGDAMGINYKGELAHSEWDDGLDFYHDICDWADKYEEKYMVPAQTNKQTADELVPLLLFYVPRKFKPAAANMVGVLMDNRLRRAMMYGSFLFRFNKKPTADRMQQVSDALKDILSSGYRRFRKPTVLLALSLSPKTGVHAYASDLRQT